MLPSYHYSRSISEAISTAFSVKHLNIFLLLAINLLMLVDFISNKDIVIKRQETEGVRIISPETMTAETMSVMAVYYALRLGNISDKTLPEIKKMVSRVLPFEKIPTAINKLKKTQAIFSKTKINEVFIPIKVDVHMGMKRVWVTGTKYIQVPGKKEKSTPFTREFEFGIKRGFIYPSYSNQYAGSSKSQLQIQQWIKKMEEES